MTIRGTTRPAALLLLALAAAGAPARAQAPPPPPPPPPPAVVPFELLVSNHMVVEARLNGKGPYRLIFDLGAPITLLGNRAGETSGVIKKNAPRSLLFAMRGEAEVGELRVGDLRVEDLPVIVLDHPALKALGDILGRPLDGIIGFTFFARYKTSIDYQKREMTFEPVDFEVKNLMKELPARLSGPKVSRTRVLAPGALFGLEVGAPREGLEAPGVPVVAVRPGSPAEAAGLKPGDVLTALDGRWTTTVADAFAAAAGATPGTPTTVEVLRDGAPMTLPLTPRDGL